MKHKWKKAAAFTLALALVAGVAPANVGTGGLFGGAAIVAYAAEESERFDTNINTDDNYEGWDEFTYTGNHFKIEVTAVGDKDGFFLSRDGGGKATITALNGEVITKIELVTDFNVGNYAGVPHITSDTAQMSVNGKTYTFTNINATSVIFDKCTDENYCQIKQVTIYYEGAEVTDISTATVNLASDNTVASITVGDDTITDLSDFDITYGTDDLHTATAVPTDAGTYYAYVTAKGTNTAYTGTAKSSGFEIVAPPTISSASVTLGDDLALNFYVDNVTAETANEYTVNFTGACVDESSALAYNATEGKYYATTHVYAKDIDKNITATLCKGDETVDTLADYSISQYLTAAESGADEKTSALITATKDFGNASSEYFYGTGSGYSDGFASYAPDTSAYAPNFDSDAAKLSLVLDSKTAARLYVKDDTTGTESTINATKADYPSYHEVTGLLPQNLADEQTITVGGTDYTFSALTWCNRVLTNGSASQKNINMAKAIMAYYQFAANYTDNTIQLAVGDLNFTYTEGQTWNDITLPDGVGIDSENHIIYNNRILSYNSSGAWVTADTEIGSPAGYYWETIYVDSVTLNQSTLTLTAGGDTATLTATVLPANATDKTVTWSSDNEAVATVVDGVVTPVAKGTATITATSGGKSDTCTVTVKQLYSITFTGPYSNATLVMEYYEGDTWNDMAAKYPTYIKIYSGHPAFYTDGFFYDEGGNWPEATDQIDPNKTYEVQ